MAAVGAVCRPPADVETAPAQRFHSLSRTNHSGGTLEISLQRGRTDLTTAHRLARATSELRNTLEH